MKKSPIMFLLATLCLQYTNTSAQTDPDTTIYQVYAYMKVAPGMEETYLKMEKAYKKLHLASKKAGLLDSWSVFRVISPAGTNCEYNYVARNGLRGRKQLAAFMDNNGPVVDWQSLLTPEEQDLVKRTNEIRSMVKVEVWSGVDLVAAKDIGKSTIAVFNYFSSPAGKTVDDHIKMEQDIWKPVHAARVKDGTMKGWFMLQMEWPFGASMPYNVMTVDVYSDMNQYLEPWFERYFQKVHPGKNIDELMTQTNAVEILQKGEVRKVIDRLEW